MFMIVRTMTTVLVLLGLSACLPAHQVTPDEVSAGWEKVGTVNSLTPRHEASAVAFEGRIYLIGGRGDRPVEVFDPATGVWTQKAMPPIEIHHFQAVVVGDRIYIIGAMTGGWPNETPLDRVLVYTPATDTFSFADTIPVHRRRGGAGAVAVDGKIYVIGGITNGHIDGYRPWTDVYDPADGSWSVLPDAPHPRDHFAAAYLDGKIYAFGGRRTQRRTGNDMDQTLTYGDVFDVERGVWEPVSASRAIPTERAGTMAVAAGGMILVGGGESAAQVPAHREIEAYDPATSSWVKLPPLIEGRHGTSFVVIGDEVYAVSGCGERGGTPELASMERLTLSAPITADQGKVETLPVYQRWHAVSLDFTGPDTSETAQRNPFTDYRLMVEFRQGDHVRTVRGFYAADGKAGDTGSESGAVWRVKFTPDRVGDWTWTARLATADMIAIDSDPGTGRTVPIEASSGAFRAVSSTRDEPDFRSEARGFLSVENGFFQFASGRYWLKTGPNSPENLLAFADLDGTYRLKPRQREGDAAIDLTIHAFAPHLDDWRSGDPVWGVGEPRGQALIGALNYIAEAGQNAIYFLTFNIEGDGNDVWPYRDPTDLTRFDVSKLDQWDRVFAYAQSRGILLHIVLQETENELLMDGGDTGVIRKLYMLELIARFGHHPGLVWNLGEENGPVHWMPTGQTDAQRLAMISFLDAADPYGHPIVIHTHSEPGDKDTILTPLLGVAGLDGVSFQVSRRETVNAEVRKWKRLSSEAGRPWLITMDEIGKWDTGAPPDADDPSRDSLRRHALWGALLAGASGVEWYFGAHFPAHDLSSEDWRLRAELWRQSALAVQFLEREVEWWVMQPCPDAMVEDGVFCLTGGGATVVYLIEGRPVDLALPDGEAVLTWFDPVSGEIRDGGRFNANDMPIKLEPALAGRDQVALIRQ